MDKQVTSGESLKKNFRLPASFYQTWIMTGGVYMMSGRCPCCGGQGCPVGLGAAVLVGGTMAGLIHGAGVLRKVLKNNGEKEE